MLEVLRLVATKKQGAVSPAVASDTVNIDVVDAFGIHWTGTVQRGTTNIRGMCTA